MLSFAAVSTGKQENVTKALAFIFILGTVAALSAQDRDILARFDGGVGVIPVQNGAGAPNADGTLPNAKLNVVRGVSPGAGPWTIADLKAVVGTDGSISVKGKGLLLASGNGLGTNANQHVFATLICEPALPFVEHSTSSAVALDPNGNFQIDDVLTNAPAECASPLLLIRAGNGTWLAAGLPKLAGN
jgi:hypothetical protein